MTKFYSKTTGGFYDDGIHTTMPADAKPITDAQWQSALDGQSQGKVIQADADGLPVAVTVAPTADQIKVTTNAAIQAQIDALEKGQNRAVREATIGMLGAVDRLKALDAKIATLRAQFVK